jgi:hypothetical protein
VAPSEKVCVTFWCAGIQRSSEGPVYEPAKEAKIRLSDRFGANTSETGANPPEASDISTLRALSDKYFQWEVCYLLNSVRAALGFIKW